MQPSMMFRGSYSCFSNMTKCEIEFARMRFPSVEHAFVAAKSTEWSVRRKVKDCSTPSKAKKFGKTVELRPDWDLVKNDVMYELVKQKFTRYKRFQDILLATDSMYIEESNYWHDNYWGSCYCDKCGGHGKNHLGKILMRVRDELHQEMQPTIGKLLLGTIRQRPEADIVLQVTFSRKNLKLNDKKYDIAQNVFWVPSLAPDINLFKWSHRSDYYAPKDWPEYKRRFFKLMEQPARQRILNHIVLRLSQGKSIGLTCFCANDRHCHRSILAELIDLKLKESNGSEQTIFR